MNCVFFYFPPAFLDRAGGSVKVKQPKDSDEQIESLVGENGENHATWLRD